ncbi:MAG: hypothetical protein SGJ00_06340 [bacterium]|nr:hypothetical protein [bacterium]
MKNQIDKKQILQACIAKQEELIGNFKMREVELYNDTYDQNAIASQTESRKDGKTELLAALGNELVFAQQELIYLNTVDVSKVCTVIEPGATIVTNHLTFFIGVSTENIEVAGEPVFGISTKAPIYAAMQGLQKGASFQFNERKYLIEDLY